MNNLPENLSFENLKSKNFTIPDFFSQDLADCIVGYHSDHRNRLYPPELTVMGVLYQAMNNASMSSAVAYLNSQRLAKGEMPASSNTASYSEAKKNLSHEIFRDCTLNTAQKSSLYIPEPLLWKGFTLHAIDGSTVTLDDTELNQKEFPQHGKQEEGVGFPIVRLVVIQCLTTGMITSANFGSYKGKETGEMALARPLISQLTRGQLLLGDRYYPSFFTLAQLQKLGVEGVFQMHAARDYDFRKGKKLGELDHIVEWIKPQRPTWMPQEEYDLYPQKIDVREIDVTCEADYGERLILVTTLLDEKCYPKQDLLDLYKRRWGIETALKDLKDTMGMHHINSKTPEGFKTVIWSYFLAYNLLKWYMLNVALLADRKLKEISLSNTIYVLTANAINIATANKANIQHIRAGIIVQILSKKVLDRPGRFEPRKVKKRPKPHQRLQESRKAWRERVTS